GDGNDLADEEAVVVPQLFRGVLPAVGERSFENLAVPRAFGGRLIERPGRGAAPRRPTLGGPDAVAHVGVGRVEDPGLREVPEVLLVFLDLPVAAREV